MAPLLLTSYPWESYFPDSRSGFRAPGLLPNEKDHGWLADPHLKVEVNSIAELEVNVGEM